MRDTARRDLEVYARADRGESPETIAAAMGIAQSTVSRLLRTLDDDDDEDLSDRQRHSSRPVDDAEIQRLWHAGGTVRAIARELGTSTATAGRHLLRLGLTRSKGFRSVRATDGAPCEA